MAKCPTKSKRSFVAIGRNASGDFLSRPDRVHLPVAARTNPITRPRFRTSKGRYATGAVAPRFSARHPPTRHPRRDARRDRWCDHWCRCRAGSDKAVAPLSTDCAFRLWTGLVPRIRDDSPWCRRRGPRCLAWFGGGLDTVIPILVVIARAPLEVVHRLEQRRRARIEDVGLIGSKVVTGSVSAATMRCPLHRTQASTR